MRDKLTENIGKTTVFEVRSDASEWDKYMLEQIRNVLDADGFSCGEMLKSYSCETRR